VNRTEVNNSITVPEAVVSHKEQRQAGKAGEEGAYRDQAKGLQKIKISAKDGPTSSRPAETVVKFRVAKAAKDANSGSQKVVLAHARQAV
jgi:hypothetical protein